MIRIASNIDNLIALRINQEATQRSADPTKGASGLNCVFHLAKKTEKALFANTTSKEFEGMLSSTIQVFS